MDLESELGSGREHERKMYQQKITQAMGIELTTLWSEVRRPNL